MIKEGSFEYMQAAHNSFIRYTIVTVCHIFLFTIIWAIVSGVFIAGAGKDTGILVMATVFVSVVYVGFLIFKIAVLLSYRKSVEEISEKCLQNKK